MKRMLVPQQDGITRASLSEEEGWQVHTIMPGQRFDCLAADPQQPDRVFAGTPDRGLFISTDGGKSWLTCGLQDQFITFVAISPVDSNRIYVGTKPASLYVSADGGETWRHSQAFDQIPNRWWWFSPAVPPDWRPYISAIACSPSDPDVLLAGVEFGGVYRSTDAGRSWSRHRRGALRDCHSLKYHALDDRVTYQAGGGGVASSRDGGDRWRKANRGLARFYGVVCAADPLDPEIWYVCVGRGPKKVYGPDPETYLYRREQGAHWIPIGCDAHPLPASPAALVTFTGQAGRLCAGLRNGDLWETFDFGESRVQLPLNLNYIGHHLAIDVR